MSVSVFKTSNSGLLYSPPTHPLPHPPTPSKLQTCGIGLQVRFQVLTAANINMTVLWDVAPCSLAEVYWP
jgi:hypothetical protein